MGFGGGSSLSIDKIRVENGENLVDRQLAVNSVLVLLATTF